jgi:hypothetical protein
MSLLQEVADIHSNQKDVRWAEYSNRVGTRLCQLRHITRQPHRPQERSLKKTPNPTWATCTAHL